MHLCRCDPPAGRDRSELRCKACGEWAAHGLPLSAGRARWLAREMASLSDRLSSDLRYAGEVAYGLSGPGDGARSAPGPSDRTANAVLGRRATVAAWAALSSRLAERALVYLRLADEAAGRALLAAEPHPGIADHVQAPYHDPATLFTGRPDLAAAYDARTRRKARGDL